jgi:hypothetical protein
MLKQSLCPESTSPSLINPEKLKTTVSTLLRPGGKIKKNASAQFNLMIPGLKPGFFILK